MSSAEIILTVLCSLAPIVSLVVAIIVARRSKDKDYETSGQEKGAMQSDIGYIKSSTDRIERHVEVIDKKQDNMSERLAKVEARLDEHMKDKNIHNYNKTAKGGK